MLRSIKQGGIKATVLQPAVELAQMAVDQAQQYLKSGSTGKAEKQLVDCSLVTADNVDQFGLFGPK